MENKRETFEIWFAGWRGVRTPAEEAAVLKMADAYDAAIDANHLSAHQLQIVVDAASSRRALLWMNAVDLLADLAARWQMGAESLSKMFSSKHANVRFAALCCVRADTPSEIADRLMRDGLKDKSSQVRWKAAEKIGVLGKKKFVAELEAALSGEKVPKAHGEIEHQLKLLRDGYIVEPSTPSRFNVTVRIHNGIRTSTVTDDEIQRKGIETVAAELRADR